MSLNANLCFRLKIKTKIPINVNATLKWCTAIDSYNPLAIDNKVGYKQENT